MAYHFDAKVTTVLNFAWSGGLDVGMLEAPPDCPSNFF